MLYPRSHRSMNSPLPPFSFASESKEFEQRWLEEIPKRLYAIQTSILPERNILKFQHGVGWTFNNTQGDEVPGEFKKHDEKVVFPVAAPKEGELERLTALADEMAQKFAGGMHRLMAKNVEEITEKTGNVVAWKRGEGNPGAVYLKLLEMVEFGIKPDGTPSEPEFYDIHQGFLNQLNAQLAASPELRAQVEAIKARKLAEAREREAARKAKFKSTG